MQTQLAGRVALVTGGASGIGRAIAHQLAAEQAVVSIVDLNLAGAQAVVSEIEESAGKALAIQCDVSSEEQVEDAIKQTEQLLGNIGILVNCAGNFQDPNLLQDMTTEAWHGLFRVHCDGMFYFSRTIVRSMKAGDRIINITSMDGLHGQILGTHYASAKGAMIAFTKTLALEVAPKGITVNAIAPGVIRTPMGQMLIDSSPGFDKQIPAHRYGEPEDIAALAVFLASMGAGYITGEVILVDGGITLANPVNIFTANMIGLT